MFRDIQSARRSIELAARDGISVIMVNELEEYIVATTVDEVAYAVEGGFDIVETY